MDLTEVLAQERRARLAAERLLEQKQAELSVANRMLSRHARALSVEIIEKREEAAEAREDLQVATDKMQIAERRLWTALTSMRDGFAVFGPDARLLAANPSWLLPFDGLEDVAPGASYRDILQIGVEEGVFDIGDATRADWVARMAERFESGAPAPMVIRLWNGAHIQLIDERAEGGDRVSLALDISATVRREKELKEARLRAEAANRAKSSFLANMSHELRTPMNGVVGMADILMESELDDEQRACAETIRSSGEALLLIINDVLDFSKLDAERMVLHPEPFDLEQVVHEVVHLMQPLTEGKALNVLVDYDMFMPTVFTGDRGRVRQILTNLIGNAVKFTDAGHVVIRVTGMPADRHRIVITVEDSGIGIEPAMAAHIFGEFNQVDGERNRKYEGTGLGLAIVRQLVSLMDGDIWVESQPGVGSTFGFHIELPADLATVAPDSPSLAGLSVAIADPSPVAASLLEGQIRSLGVTVASFPDGAALIEGMAAGTAAVFADVRLTDMTPAELSAALRNADKAAPVVALSRFADPQPPGLDEVLVRPILRGALREALARLVTTREPAEPEATVSPQEPLTPAAPTADAPDAPLHLPTDMPIDTPRQMRVLAAEDNKTNQLVLSKMLKTLDIDLRFAGNGVEAVALQAEWQPDMIFMDISMPEMDGKEATRRIREAEAGSGRHTPIVALTAHALSGDDEAILAAGLDHYLTKPLKKAAIVERIVAAQPDECRPVVAEEALETPMPPPAMGFLSSRGRATAAT